MLSNGAKDYKAKLFENHDENIHFLLNTPLSLPAPGLGVCSHKGNTTCGCMHRNG